MAEKNLDRTVDISPNLEQKEQVAARLRPMTRAQNTTIWGVALVVGALILGKVDENPIPWAVAAIGAIALIAGGLMAAIENDAAQNASTVADPSTAESSK